MTNLPKKSNDSIKFYIVYSFTQTPQLIHQFHISGPFVHISPLGITVVELATSNLCEGHPTQVQTGSSPLVWRNAQTTTTIFGNSFPQSLPSYPSVHESWVKGCSFEMSDLFFLEEVVESNSEQNIHEFGLIVLVCLVVVILALEIVKNVVGTIVVKL